MTTANALSDPREKLDRLRLLVLAAQRDGARRLSEILRRVQLTPNQAEILAVLAQSGPLSLSEVGRRIVCEAGSPSRAVDTLVKRGLVDRVQSADDRRYVTLEITTSGSALLPVIIEGITALDEGILDKLTAGEISQLCTLLDRLLDGTEGQTAIDLRCGPLTSGDHDALPPLVTLRNQTSRRRPQS